MTVDENVEPLPANIDLYIVMIEALSLSMPAYPRAQGAELGNAVFSERGVTPMSDDDAKPFAGLGDLRKALEKKDDRCHIAQESKKGCVVKDSQYVRHLFYILSRQRLYNRVGRRQRQTHHGPIAPTLS